MKPRLIGYCSLLTLILTVLLASCAPALATLKEPASLYAGPGNVSFKSLGQLPAGTQVSLQGSAVDFVQVEAQGNGVKKRGFLLKKALQDLPSGLAELPPLELPGQPVDVINSFFNGETNIQGNQVTIENTGDEVIAPEGGGIPLDSPFRLTSRIEPRNSTRGILKLLGSPEAAEGDWWKGVRRMDVQADGVNLNLVFYDGRTQTPNQIVALDLPANSTFTLVANDPQGKLLTILDEFGAEVKTVDVTRRPGLHMPDGLFAERKLYLGAGCEPHSTLVISNLLFEKIPSGKQEPEKAAEPSLRELARQRGITIGTEFSEDYINDANTWRIMKRDFDTVNLSSLFEKDEWQGPGVYDFTRSDKMVNFALQSGFKLRSSVVWGDSRSFIPDWLLNGNYSREDYIRILNNYVKTWISRYKGQVSEWIVVNEPYSRSLYPGSDFWGSKIGPEYIEMSFRWAREVDPTGVLILNDVNNESPRDENTQQTIDMMYDSVKTLKENGVPIDVVGMQMHLFHPFFSQVPPKKADIIATMRRFGELGVKVYITELDVNLQYIPGSQAKKWKYEADLYKNVMEACLESGVCTSFSVWGISDGTSWIVCPYWWCLNSPDADPLLFDRDFNPKPAYYAVRDALMQGAASKP